MSSFMVATDNGKKWLKFLHIYFFFVLYFYLYKKKRLMQKVERVKRTMELWMQQRRSTLVLA